ncbi:MAG: hypothetical protein JSS81_19070 [Acidobacteria bacterium]|nr:hypothetical protein [Acidobacteriota bacterium]
MKLPVHLAPWAEQLRLFPDELSLTLGEYARRVAPLIGPLNAAADDPDGEPNGYDGVARRGIYERLLLSEFALADEFPEEFIRRAVMGEHLFLHPARVSTGTKRVSIALFDTGAMQLGAPRIAHLAAFIVLARRAEAAGAAFLWGALQDARQLVLSDDTEASLKILLESRTAREVRAEDLEAWREKLAGLDRTDDVWLVGDDAVFALDAARGFSRIGVGESVELDKRELYLRVKGVSGALRRTTLALPAPEICTRLLRDPFERPPQITTTHARLGGALNGFFFDGTGSKLFARIDGRGLLMFSVQNVKGPDAIHPVAYNALPHTSEPRDFIAVGRLRKALVAASRFDERTLRLDYLKSGFNLKKGLYRTRGEKIAFPENESGLLQIYNVRPDNFYYDEAAILDAAGNLFLLNPFGQNPAGLEPVVGTLMPIATDVLAVVQSMNRFVYIGCEDGHDYHRLIAASGRVERLPLAGKKLKRAFFGRGEMGRKSIAFEDEAGSWTVSDEDGNLRIMPRPRGAVVGVYEDRRFAPVAGLFELMDDRRTLEFCWQHGRRREILKTDAEIARIEFSPRSPVFAYQTVDGELVLYSLTHRAAIGRYSK